MTRTVPSKRVQGRSTSRGSPVFRPRVVSSTQPGARVKYPRRALITNACTPRSRRTAKWRRAARGSVIGGGRSAPGRVQDRPEARGRMRAERDLLEDADPLAL